MEEALLRTWEYMEKAGVASAMIMSIILYWTRKELIELRAKHDAVQEKRIEEGRTAYSIVENSTRETKTLIDLVRALRPWTGGQG